MTRKTEAAVKGLKAHCGLALIAVGAILLAVCYVAGVETNTELLAGLALIIAGFSLHIWLQKRAEKY